MIAVCHFQDDLAAFYIRRKGFQGIVHNKLYSHGGGQMKYRVAAFGELIDQKLVEYSANDQMEILISLEVLDILVLAGRKVIENGHLMPFAHQFVSKMGTDETGSSGDQVMHGLGSFCRAIL